MNNALIETLLIVGGIIVFTIILSALLYLLQRKKCNKCGGGSYPTGVCGTKYKQYQCKRCYDIFSYKHSK